MFGFTGLYMRKTTIRLDMEKRLHRVKISPITYENIKCDHSKNCAKAENCIRCNQFYLKCSEFGKFS